MKFTLAILGVLLIAATTTANDTPRVSCSAFSALKIRVRGTGRCRGTASADCKAIASAQDDFQEAYAEWWNDDGGCDAVKLEAAAVAIATACASVYTTAIAKVTCVGAGGFACGFSITEGSAYAEALAKAAAQAIADVGTDDADAFCISDVEAIAGAIAEAAASSQAKACVKGTGSASQFSSAFVESVATAIADAFASATASTCDKSGAAAASTTCDGEAGGQTLKQFKAGTGGSGPSSAGGRAGEIDSCEDVYGLSDCCDPGYSSGICREEGIWRRQRDFDGDVVRTWLRRSGGPRVNCQCKAPKT